MLVPVSFVGSETVPIVDVIDVVTVGDSLMPTAVSDYRLPGRAIHGTICWTIPQRSGLSTEHGRRGSWTNAH